MKIWQATESDTQIRFYWFATKREALAHKRAYEPPFKGATCEIEEFDVTPTRAGIVDTMNWIMRLTCWNE